MKKDMPLEGLRWSRDSGSALYDTPQTAVLGRAGGGDFKMSKNNKAPQVKTCKAYVMRFKMGLNQRPPD